MGTPLVATRRWSLKPLGALHLWTIVGLAGTVSLFVYFQVTSIGFDPLVSGFALLATIIAAAVAGGVSAEALAKLPALATLPNAFDRTELRAKAGATVALRLENQDTTSHSFDIDELNVHALMPASATSLALFTPSTPGSYTFYCSLPGHREAGMDGTLIVEP